MDRIEKLKFQQSIENYFEENKVYELFEKLLKELIVNKPIDPIGYMVKRIQTKDMKRIFITGIMGTNRKEICLSLAESFGYSCVSLGDLLTKEIGKKDTNARKIEAKLNKVNLVDDETVIGLLKKELIRLERENGCYIIEGFPRNRVRIFIIYINK
jgi:adenylate kinase